MFQKLNMGDWVERALCRTADPDMFFPESGNEHEVAVKLCGECPVRSECLTWALNNERFGVWGGTTPGQRQRLKRRAA